ncbi:DUF4176 domain-containing protein [Bombilactobacillus thymidiniphilus]|uniref:DUF4176 domain-containing protein n=1 Tax=Bombilactobacillus thymidiniphilus TaxID=2923363 RepID=A0ABY4PD07_9LACO|nr:DUF4176 domain-containing protein [Bombilactobacillus thymidiniphilus]UQS83401.1 DUF4176 domain-containing protein [Bombilactobacillus thymidiniphilus]
MSEILPIGSVVTLKGENATPVMVTSRAAIYQEISNKTGYFDYSAVLYPDGVEDPQDFIFFNREDIAELLFKGFVNAEESEFAQHYDQLVNDSGYPKLHIKD